jgi:hypothetical protein
MKILIHVGLHRAASTALQRWLRSRADDWLAAGRFVHAGLAAPTSESPFAVLVGQHLATLGPQAAADFLLARLEDMQKKFAAGVVSEENLPGPMPGSGVPFVALAPLAEALDRLAEHHEIVPVVVLREHVDWLRSLHHTQQLRGEHRSFTDFVNSLPLERLRFAGLVDRLTAGGRRPAIVTSREAVKADQGRGLQGRIAEALGLAGEPLPGLGEANVARDPQLRHLASLLGARRAMLVEAGGKVLPPLLEALRRAPQEPALREAMAALLRERAVRVPWDQPPGQRMRLANAAFREGLLPAQRLRLEECRAVVAASLASPPSAVEDEQQDGRLREIFAADRASLAATCLPEWRTPPS